LSLGGLTSAPPAFADQANLWREPPPLTVPKARCGEHDHSEAAARVLQGQVPMSMRITGFQGFNCNLELVGQVRGDGANWQSDEFREQHRRENRGRADHTCAYHGTAYATTTGPTTGRTQIGVPVIDMANPRAPTPTEYLTTISMLDPWESLKVNTPRELLAADNAHNGGGGQGGPEVDVYDISTDCRYPQLLASVAVGTGTDGGVPSPIFPNGHEGVFAPDGLTYYRGDLANAMYHAIDVSDPTRPKEIASYDIATALSPLTGIKSHGLSLSDDGNRAYVAVLGGLSGPGYDPTAPATNGFAILDTSQVRERKPNAQIKLISSFLYKDGSVSQHTIPARIKGKQYIIQVDEGGSGGITYAGWQSACAAGVPMFPMARIVDISNEKKPTQVSELMLEVNKPANCQEVLPDIVGLAIFTYGTHYCSVDNREDTTTLACDEFNSGIRVFDIRDPARPKEIAYYNPAGATTASPGSNHVTFAQWKAGGPDWCSAQLHLDAEKGTIWTTCQDNGLLSLKFTHGVWPFPESSTPPGKQN
jgi:LVIVD repeat